MKKELFLAILIGLLVGLVIVFGVYRTKIIFTPKNKSSTLEASPSPEASADIISNLVIHSPLNESIQEKEDVTIAGSTNHNEFVVILVNEEEFVTTADESGNFSISAQLETGSNIIEINSINEDGKLTTEELTVIYTSKPLIETPEEEAVEDSTDTNKENNET
jgi:hypothetical protein